ncbi:MAG: hypothetical protein DWQ53_02695 [Microcystis flos-aquae DF17]|nr:MAG: hypothetical protein DWQ53_02695 [Microcystis flos-aquae DF17]
MSYQLSVISHNSPSPHSPQPTAHSPQPTPYTLHPTPHTPHPTPHTSLPDLEYSGRRPIAKT